MKIDLSFDLDTIIKAVILFAIKESLNGLSQYEIELKVNSFIECLKSVLDI